MVAAEVVAAQVLLIPVAAAVPDCLVQAVLARLPQAPLVRITAPLGLPPPMRQLLQAYKAAEAVAAGVQMRLRAVLAVLLRLALLAVEAVVAGQAQGQFTIAAVQAAHPATSQAVQQARPTATAPQFKAVTASHLLAQPPVPQAVAVAHLTAPTPLPNPATAATAAHRAALAAAAVRASTP
jgi:hypothetical protein